MFTTTANFKGLFSGVSKPDFIIGIEIDCRFLMVAVVVAVIGITRLTNLLVSGFQSYRADWSGRVGEVEDGIEDILEWTFC